MYSVQSQARCLLDRVRGLGDGAAAAARRRHWAEREEERLCSELWELSGIGPGGLNQSEFTEPMARHLWTYFCKIKYLIFQR